MSYRPCRCWIDPHEVIIPIFCICTIPVARESLPLVLTPPLLVRPSHHSINPLALQKFNFTQPLTIFPQSHFNQTLCRGNQCQLWFFDLSWKILLRCDWARLKVFLGCFSREKGMWWGLTFQPLSALSTGVVQTIPCTLYCTALECSIVHLSVLFVLSPARRNHTSVFPPFYHRWLWWGDIQCVSTRTSKLEQRWFFVQILDVEGLLIALPNSLHLSG